MVTRERNPSCKLLPSFLQSRVLIKLVKAHITRGLFSARKWKHRLAEPSSEKTLHWVSDKAFSLHRSVLTWSATKPARLHQRSENVLRQRNSVGDQIAATRLCNQCIRSTTPSFFSLSFEHWVTSCSMDVGSYR